MISSPLRTFQNVSNTINVEARNTPVQTAVENCVIDGRCRVREPTSGAFRAEACQRVGMHRWKFVAGTVLRHRDHERRLERTHAEFVRT